jgi:heavy metal translocating P-type ATPase
MESPAQCCDLCGLPLHRGFVEPASSLTTPRFCCVGCKQVFTLLSESAPGADPISFRETEVFKRCRELGIIPRSPMDVEKLRQREARGDRGGPGTAQGNGSSRTQEANAPAASSDSRDPGLEKKSILTLNLKVDNLWCPACAWVIEEALKKVPGVVTAACSFSIDGVHCRYNPVKTSPSVIRTVIKSLGYHAEVPGEAERGHEKRRELVRFAISLLITLNVMMLSLGVYSGFIRFLSPETIARLSWPAGVLAGIVLFYGGHPIYRKACHNLRHAAFGMETLVTVGAFSAYLYSIVGIFSGSIHLYFDTASMLITLVLLGKLLERNAKDHLQEEVSSLFSLKPTKVKICTEQFPQGHYVAAERLAPGDTFQVEAGEVVPADGTILAGSGAVDESSLTGEATPLGKTAGGQLKSGTKVLFGTLIVKAERVGKDSLLHQMLQVIEKALREKPPAEDRTDHLLRWFVPVVLTLALGTGVGGFLSGLSTEASVLRMLTVMVISCPCALGIAVPLTRMAAVSLAWRNGVLVRDFSAFERLRKVNAFVLDKTGTITTGKWTLRETIPQGVNSKAELLALAAGLERDVPHVIAMEINTRTAQLGIEPARVEQVVVHPNGISGLIDGERVCIGSAAFLREEGAAPSELHEIIGPSHLSRVYLALEEKMCGMFVFGDEIRASSAAAVDRLKALGHRLTLVSGDADDTTALVGRLVGIDSARGGMLPREKAAFVEELQRKGACVAMVGDGVNDAAALAHADLAIAVHSGGSFGEQISDLTLMRGEPGQLIDILALAERVNRKLRQNLAATFLYNTLSIPIAMTGLLNPLIAVSAMLLSSLSVIGNTLLLVRRAG